MILGSNFFLRSLKCIYIGNFDNNDSKLGKSNKCCLSKTKCQKKIQETSGIIKKDKTNDSKVEHF